MTVTRIIRTCRVFALLLLWLPLLSCDSDSDRAFDEGVDAGFATGREDGLQRGRWRGAADGSSEGIASAADGAREGSAALIATRQRRKEIALALLLHAALLA